MSEKAQRAQRIRDNRRAWRDAPEKDIEDLMILNTEVDHGRYETTIREMGGRTIVRVVPNVSEKLSVRIPGRFTLICKMRSL